MHLFHSNMDGSPVFRWHSKFLYSAQHSGLQQLENILTHQKGLMRRDFHFIVCAVYRWIFHAVRNVTATVNTAVKV